MRCIEFWCPEEDSNLHVHKDTSTWSLILFRLTFRHLNLFLRSDSHGWYCLSIYDLSSLCANMDQMCTKVLTTDITDMLLFLESTTGWQTTKIDTICGLHFGVLRGPCHPYPLYIHRLCQWGGFGVCLMWRYENEMASTDMHTRSG